MTVASVALDVVRAFYSYYVAIVFQATQFICPLPFH